MIQTHNLIQQLLSFENSETHQMMIECGLIELYVDVVHTAVSVQEVGYR